MNTLWQQCKNVYHYLQAQAWRARFGWPDKKMKLYGITGTNGKTTTAFALGNILRAAYGKEKVGLLSTEVFWLGQEERANATHMTTTDAKIIFKLMREMANAGVEHVALEITSHALDQHRLAGIKLAGGIILNITHEHLDYHQTMEAYRQAKWRVADYLKPGAALVVRDDTNPDNIKVNCKLVQFSSEQAKSVQTKLPGDFNKENVLAATLLAKELDIAEEKIVQGINSLEKVPGRMDWVELPNGARAVIDFALTPDAMQQLYDYLKKEAAGNVIAVFGAAGRRDRAKRPVITKIASQYVDELVLTQDEPYEDNEEEIYQELESGIPEDYKSWKRIPDRREAISYAIKNAKPGDIIAITGMGNYSTRAVGGKMVPWNDKKVVQEIITEL